MHTTFKDTVHDNIIFVHIAIANRGLVYVAGNYLWEILAAQVYGEAIVPSPHKRIQMEKPMEKEWSITGQEGGGRSHFQRECVIPVITWRRCFRLRCVCSLIVGTIEVAYAGNIVDWGWGPGRWDDSVHFEWRLLHTVHILKSSWKLGRMLPYNGAGGVVAEYCAGSDPILFLFESCYLDH